LLLWI